MSAFLFIVLGAFVVCAMSWAFFRGHKTDGWRSMYRITLGEAAVVFLIVSVISGATIGISAYQNRHDVEILAGSITDKKQVRVSCSHSYPCRCRQVCSGFGKSRSCSTRCDTCYRHTHDYDWRVYTTLGSFNIQRIDSQGTGTPPRWTGVVIGEPYAEHRSYTNYIKGAEHTLWNNRLNEEDMARLQAIVPAYPSVFDYYRVNRAVTSPSVKVPNIQEWSDRLAAELRDLGAKKQVNIIVVFTDRGREYVEALERVWLGGKKNDVVVVLGLEGENVAWSQVFTYARSSGNELLTVKLRDAIMAVGQPITNAEAYITTIRSNIEEAYQRKSMEEFEHLASESGPSTTGITIAAILGLIVLIGGLIVAHKVEFFK